MLYGLLGELRIGRDGQLLDLPSGRSLIVFAALLANANRRMSKTDLLRAAWGDNEVGEAQLHKSIAAIRETLSLAGRRDDLVTHARQGYEMRLSDDDLDMLLFERLVREAEEAKVAGRSHDEIESLRAALALWRGPHPLTNVPGGAFAREIADLDRRRKRAAVRLFDLAIVRGDHERIAADVAAMVTLHPTDRRLCEQLMIVLYRCGHETDAVTAYERYAEQLDEQTAGTPDAALRTLSYAIGRHDDPAIDAAEAAIAKRLGAASGPALAVPRQLPREPADFVGRADLVAEGAWLLSRRPDSAAPVVVIFGQGGIGKTALARRVAHRVRDHYTDGQLYAELRGTTAAPVEPGEVLAQFLRALGAASVPETAAERASTYRTLTARRRILVVLDDAADEAQIRDLVPAGAGCATVVTSRRRLPGIDGTHHLPPLEPLDPATARDLFLRVTRNSGVELAAESDGVDRIVALCGGLPLALRIAAALRVRDHPRSTQVLADRLARQGPRAFAYGEESVARTIGAGFDRLGPSARRLFLALGLLDLSTFGLWTAAAVLDTTDEDAEAALSELAASNMTEAVEADARYRFHELTREYAGGLARTTDGDADVVGRAYRALLTLVRRAHAGLHGGPFEVIHSAVDDWDAPPSVSGEVDRSPLDWFERERANIRAAVDHCADLGHTDLCWDLAVSAHEFYTMGGYFDDWHATHTTALRACRAAGDLRGEGIVLACLGQPALVASRPAGATSSLADLERAADLLARSGDRHGRAIAQRTLANALRRRGHLTRPLTLFEEALAGYEESGDVVGCSQTLRFIGQTHLDLHAYGAALRVLAEAERVAAVLGDARLLAQVRYWIGRARLAASDKAGAEAAFAAMVEVFPEPVGLGHAYAMHGLGDVARVTGALTVAERSLTVAAGLARDGNDAVLEGRVQLSLAELEAASGRPDRREAALQAALARFAECGAIHLQIEALTALGAAYEDRGDRAAVFDVWERIGETFAEMDLPEEDRVWRRPIDLLRGA